MSGEDCTTIGEGGSTGIKPGSNAVTVPILTAPVVICVVALCVMPEWSTTEVYATGCANAKGAIIMQTRTIVIRLMGVPFVELLTVTVTVTVVVKGRGDARVVADHVCAVWPIHALGDVLSAETWLVNIPVFWGDNVA